MLDPITKGYISMHPAAAARTLARLDGRYIEAIFGAMPHQLAAKVVEHMAPGSASRCLIQLPTDTSSQILARTPILAAVSALRLMKRERVQALLGLMPRPTAARLRLRLRFSESVIGSFVDEDLLSLAPDHRVGDALRLLRRTGRRTGQTIPVLDEHRHLAGVVDLSDLLGARDRSLIQNIMRPASTVLHARNALQSVTSHPAWLTHDSLPVINRAGIFQGVLRRSKVMEEEQQLLSEVAEHNELAVTRTALADIFWIGVGSLFGGNNNSTAPNKAGD